MTDVAKGLAQGTEPPQQEDRGVSAYRIFGRAHPERGGWWFAPIEIAFAGADGHLDRFRASMHGSQFHASLEVVPRRSIEPLDAKVVLEDRVRAVLDSIGLLAGSAVDCEVVFLETPDGQTVVLDSAFPGLGLSYSETEFSRLVTAAYFVRGLRLGLADFRQAVRAPQDTIFLCYRGLDGVRADMAEREAITNQKTSWQRLRDCTGLKRSEIDEIKDSADSRRHGGAPPVTQEERTTALRLLQRTLLAYAAWCAENVEPLAGLVSRSSKARTPS